MPNYMLNKQRSHINSNLVSTTGMSGRSQKIILTTEGKVLRELRLKHSLSMRAAGERLGFSDSYISQIENGRADPPKGESLIKFLELYGNITPKYFGELCRNWTTKKTDVDHVQDLLPKLKPDQLKLLRAMAEQMAKGV